MPVVVCKKCRATNLGVVRDAPAGITLTVALAVAVAPVESVSLSVNPSDVLAFTLGAINDAALVVAPARVTVGPDVWLHV